jgi:CheY-like chemotaxis protein
MYLAWVNRAQGANRSASTGPACGDDAQGARRFHITTAVGSGVSAGPLSTPARIDWRAPRPRTTLVNHGQVSPPHPNEHPAHGAANEAGLTACRCDRVSNGPDLDPSAARSVGKILVVDPDREVRELVSFALRRAGYAVTTPAGFEGDLAELRVYAEGHDLVLLDPVLAWSESIKLCRQLRHASGIGVIVVTTRNREDRLLDPLAYGVDDYLLKPLSPSVLVKRVEALLCTRTGFTLRHVRNPGELTHEEDHTTTFATSAAIPRSIDSLGKRSPLCLPIQPPGAPHRRSRWKGHVSEYAGAEPLVIPSPPEGSLVPASKSGCRLCQFWRSLMGEWGRSSEMPRRRRSGFV